MNSSELKFVTARKKYDNKQHKKFLLLKPKIRKTVNKHQWVKNLSDTEIPSDVPDIVSLGSSFSSVSSISKDDVCTIVKIVENCLQSLDINHTIKNEIREIITNNVNMTLKKVNHISNEEKSFTNKLNITKTFLKNNRNILFTRADKGNVTVCLNKSDFQTKILELLSDTNTYQTVNKNPLDSLQRNASKILKSLNKNEFLQQKFHNNQLTLTDTVFAKCYGLPKIHKENASLRPIISLVNSPTYWL